VNEALYEELTVEKLQNIIDALPEDPHDYKDPTINFAEANGH
jgi:hypothetical protein